MALDDWLRIAADGSDEDVREWILTGVKAGKPFTPYVPTLDLPAELGSVLDFGCGLGRNFPYLRRLASRVTGFDLPPMIARCRAALGPEGAAALDLLDDWKACSARRFDLVFASLVLQHIDTPGIEASLAGFARMAPLTYVLSRGATDAGDNVFAIIARTGLFHAGDLVEVEHDPASHQLRRIRQATWDEAARPGSGTHFEVLLRSLP